MSAVVQPVELPADAALVLAAPGKDGVIKHVVSSVNLQGSQMFRSKLGKAHSKELGFIRKLLKK